MIDATPIVLAVLALLLAGPAPALIAAADWPVRVPRAALAFWQALALAAVLATIGSGLSVGMLIVGAQRSGPALVAVHAAALTLTVVVTARLLWSAHKFGTAVRAQRRTHRSAVDLVSRSDPRAPGADVLELGTPTAYCIPGFNGRLVVSAAALDRLTDDELRAVLEHERAHLRARHDLVLEGFAVLHRAFPRVVRSRAALDATSGLVEMLADDAARARVGAVPLARALTTLATAPSPTGALGSGGNTVTRVRRLGEPVGPRVRALALAVYSAAVALVVVPTVTVAVPWVSTLVAALNA